MKYLSISALALAGSTFATAVKEKRQSLNVPQGVNTASVLGVLATALPQTVVSAALADTPGFVNSVESALAAGQTPSWFSQVPTEYLPYFVSAKASAAGSPPSYETSPPSGSSASSTATGPSSTEGPSSASTPTAPPGSTAVPPPPPAYGNWNGTGGVAASTGGYGGGSAAPTSGYGGGAGGGSGGGSGDDNGDNGGDNGNGGGRTPPSNNKPSPSPPIYAGAGTANVRLPAGLLGGAAVGFLGFIAVLAL